MAGIERTWGLALGWGLLGLIAWDMLGLDLSLARWYGTPLGFAWRDDPVLSRVLHDAARQLGWVVLLGLTAGAAWPVGGWRTWPPRERWAMVAAVWVSLLLVVAIKRWSTTSCPWDLAEFGGSATYVSHWQWGVTDAGGGRCFPGGHASTAFGLLAVPLWVWRHHPAWARGLLVGVLLTGLGLGWVQQVRGAHYLSHNLWTAWLCAATAWACAWGLRKTQPRR